VRNVARVVEYPPVNFGDTASVRCRFMGYWAPGARQWAERDELITVFRRQNYRFRKQFSKIGLSYNVAVHR